MSLNRLLGSPQPTEFHAESIEMYPTFAVIVDQLFELRRQSKCVAQQFEEFKEQTIHELNKSLGRLSSLIQRETAKKVQLSEELSVVTFSNQTMKKEVVQLREMIEEFVRSYNTEVEAKDAEIKELKTRLGLSELVEPTESDTDKEVQCIRKSLEVIQ
jgi:uncharacterized protein YeaO (DUF488 family)